MSAERFLKVGRALDLYSQHSSAVNGCAISKKGVIPCNAIMKEVVSNLQHLQNKSDHKKLVHIVFATFIHFLGTVNDSSLLRLIVDKTTIFYHLHNITKCTRFDHKMYILSLKIYYNMMIKIEKIAFCKEKFIDTLINSLELFFTNIYQLAFEKKLNILTVESIKELLYFSDMFNTSFLFYHKIQSSIFKLQSKANSQLFTFKILNSTVLAYLIDTSNNLKNDKKVKMKNKIKSFSLSLIPNSIPSIINFIMDYFKYKNMYLNSQEFAKRLFIKIYFQSKCWFN